MFWKLSSALDTHKPSLIQFDPKFNVLNPTQIS